jgi:hypothetical protein
MKDWRRIARASKQSQAEQDVAQQAYMHIIGDWMAWFDMSNTEHWGRLKDEMFNHFMKVARQIPKGLSIDQASGNNPDKFTNPYLLELSALKSSEPLQHLIDAEDRHVSEEEQDRQIQANSFSIAVAYVELFERLKPKTEKYTYLNIAAVMKMSYSWLRRCLNRADELLKNQTSLFDGIEGILMMNELGSWRRFKITRDSKSAPVVLHGQLSLFQ